jgi:hypothetical protein
MSKFVTSADKNGLGLRLCWRAGTIESVVLEDAQVKKPGDRSRNSDGVHIKLGVQVVPHSAWEGMNLDEELEAIQEARASGKQPVLNKAMKALAERVSSRAADERVTLVDSASEWALSLRPAEEYAQLLKHSKVRPARMLQDLKDQADAENVAMRKQDWAVLENHILIAMGLKPNRIGKPVAAGKVDADLDEGADAGDDVEVDEVGDFEEDLDALGD